MSQALTVFLNIFAYSDGAPTNNPRLRDFDYARQIPDVPTSKTRSEQHEISPSEDETIISLARTIDSTPPPTWTVSVDTGAKTRLTWSTNNPVLRTERITGTPLIAGDVYTVARLGASQVVRITLPASRSLGAGIVQNDEIILGADSGLDLIFQGVYIVVGSGTSVGQQYVDIIAPDLEDNPAVTVGAAPVIYTFSPGPVRVGDTIKIPDGFSYGNRGEFIVTAVTSRYVEYRNQDAAPEAVTPATADDDIVIYDQLYKFCYIESNQKVKLFVNDGNEMLIEPHACGQAGLVGFFMLRGPVYKVRIENLGPTPATVMSFFAR